MKSKVFFSEDPTLVTELFDAAEIGTIFSPDDPVALKIHFGEPGNTAYLKPHEVEPIALRIESLGGKPFYADCNTLYPGPRKETKTHLAVAIDHGYKKDIAGADAFIPEEDDSITVDVNLKHFKKVYLGNIYSDTIIALSHFKGHEVAGFGGAIKNLGMGIANRFGKLKMHQDCKNCKEAKTCDKNETVTACWGGSSQLVQEKIVEYAYGATRNKKCAYINYIIRVSPQCDCYGFTDAPIVEDIGILASFDLVAIDKASVDLVNKKAGKDIFRSLYPDVDWTVQLRYAEEIGLGTKEYDLIIL